jgi:hypothetical protein
MSSHQLPTGLTRGYSNYCLDSQLQREQPHVLTVSELDAMDAEEVKQ